MTELLLGAIPVLLVWFWRISFDAGRAHQRRLSVINPGEALLFDVGAMRFALTPEDGRRLMRDWRADDRADAMAFATQSRVDFQVTKPDAAFKITGIV